MGVIYRAEAPEQIVRVTLGAIDVLYHRPSGATHLVAAPVPQIIHALAEGPTDVTGLMARLASQFDLDEADGDAVGALTARLDELAGLGLVRVDPEAGR